jgi:hypothetical protein
MNILAEDSCGNMLDLNITLIIFNRPDTTRIVFDQIRRAKPKRLFVIADGPRPGRPEEVQRCLETRRIVEEGVDWDCEVKRNFSDVNLGCRNRPPTGLDWVFEQVEHSIVLEDDCVPDPSFFRFCQELLERFREDERVMMISGDNFLFDHKKAPYSYYFSDIPHIWGWATWRRAWKKYDINLSLWPEVKKGRYLNHAFPTKRQAKFWTDCFDLSKSGFNTWDHQWTFACIVNRGVCIMPSVNLITNIGFDQNATHTTQAGMSANLKTLEMNFPLSHPPFMIRDAYADLKTFNVFNPLRSRIKDVFRRLVSPIRNFFPRRRA